MMTDTIEVEIFEMEWYHPIDMKLLRRGNLTIVLLTKSKMSLPAIRRKISGDDMSGFSSSRRREVTTSRKLNTSVPS